MPFFKTYDPSPALHNLLREIQVFQMDFSIDDENLPPPYITCLANTEQNLYFFPRDTVYVVPAPGIAIPAPAAAVTGPKDRPVGLKFGNNHMLIKAAFYPTGMFRLLGTDMQVFVNKGLDAADFWGSEVEWLLQQIRTAPSYDKMVHSILQFLEARLESACRPEEPIDKVARLMLDPNLNHSLSEWAAMACLSLRQFERQFIYRVGFSPKIFLRIVRFENAMRIKSQKPERSWADIALECDYTDSSHLLKEFRTFAEFSPSNFFMKPTSGNNALPTG